MSMESRAAGTPGTFFGVGVGPGDPELLTVKAERLLRRVPVVCVPRGREEGESYARSIVAHLLDPSRQEVLELAFPMTRDRTRREAGWELAREQIVARLLAGQDVAFVTEGDPFVYSTFVDLYRLIRERHPELPVEVVPGVSSVNAAAAAAGLPLVDGAERLAVLPASYEGEALANVLERFDAVVLLKVSPVFDRLLDTLEALDLADRAVYVRRCGSAEQEIVRDLRGLRGKALDYLSLVIVRKQQRAEKAEGSR